MIMLYVDKGAAIALETDNNTDYYFSVNGGRVDGRDLEAEVADGTLSQLPSNQTAFKRFYSLAGAGGKEVCPYPSTIGSITSDQFFASGKLAFLIELLGRTDDIDKVLEDEFKYAPLPIYKTYSDPADPFCDTVAVQGKSAVHSYGAAYMVSAKSTHKEEAAVFLNWIITEGMRFNVSNGSNAIRKSDEELMLEVLDTYNPSVVLDVMPIAQAGDWWYLPDSLWIDTWANPLNNEVRNGVIGWDEFIYAYTDKTNESLDAIARGD